MKTCERCQSHAVPTQERLCNDCRFIYELGFAAIAIIIAGVFFATILSV